MFSATNFSELRNGDFATIYDIEGLLSATAPVGFSVSAQNTGIDAFGTAPTDDPTLPNVTFTRTGGTVTTDTVFTAIVVSEYGNFTQKNYTGEDSDSSGLPQGEIGLVGVASAATAAVPGPSSVVLLGAGAAMLGGWGLRRPRRRPA